MKGSELPKFLTDHGLAKPIERMKPFVCILHEFWSYDLDVCPTCEVEKVRGWDCMDRDPPPPPTDFVCFYTRPKRFTRNDDGTYDEWLWDREWIWSDNVCAETAAKHYADDVTVATFPRSPPTKGSQ